MEQLCCIKEDLHQLCEEMERVKELHQNTKLTVMQSLQDASDYLFRQSESTLNESKTIDKLIDDIGDKEKEIETLKQLIDKARKRVPLYVPIKDDPIDTALAEYLNSRSDPLAVPFTREDQGVYIFGTKKIYLKLDFGKISSKFYLSKNRRWIHAY
jgi:glycerophosphoryl diester phosphodiesterase